MVWGISSEMYLLGLFPKNRPSPRISSFIGLFIRPTVFFFRIISIRKRNADTNCHFSTVIGRNKYAKTATVFQIVFGFNNMWVLNLSYLLLFGQSIMFSRKCNSNRVLYLPRNAPTIIRWCVWNLWTFV